MHFCPRRRRGLAIPALLAASATLASPVVARPAEPVRAAERTPGELVDFNRGFQQGSIVVVNTERRLYYVLGQGRAMRYPIAVGVPGEQWTGRSFVQAKAKHPSWVPPWSRRTVVPAGPDNPLGARALYLGWSLYRIHGTNAPASIGGAASYGCFRMHNRHVRDLYERVHIGAPVYVVNAL